MGGVQLNDPGNTLCYFVDENGSYTTIGNTKGEFKVGVRSSVLNIFIGGLMEELGIGWGIIIPVVIIFSLCMDLII